MGVYWMYGDGAYTVVPGCMHEQTKMVLGVYAHFETNHFFVAAFGQHVVEAGKEVVAFVLLLALGQGEADGGGMGSRKPCISVPEAKAACVILTKDSRVLALVSDDRLSHPTFDFGSSLSGLVPGVLPGS
jgi:hypothetical protein